MINLALVVAAALSALPSISLAQSSAPSSLIPSTGVSQGCTTFLENLNSDPAISQCTAPLLEAVSYYTNASSSASSTGSVAASTNNELDTSLGQLCGSNSDACDDGMVRQRLTYFYGNCSDELRGNNSAVVSAYDVLYVLNPFRSAVCSKDTNGQYCVMNITKATAPNNGKRSVLPTGPLSIPGEPLPLYSNSLAARQAASNNNNGLPTTNVSTVAAQKPNSAQFRSSNLAFLFMQPTDNTDVLCTSCSQAIMAAYISFEVSVPYAVGLSQSGILGGQSDLYKGMKAQCGSAWLQGVSNLAGVQVLSPPNAAPSPFHLRFTDAAVVSAVAAVVGAVALAPSFGL